MGALALIAAAPGRAGQLRPLGFAASPARSVAGPPDGLPRHVPHATDTWGCSVPGVKLGRDLSWLKDWRVIVFGIGCALAGFLVALLIFGEPWHLPPNWGDIPTWLAVLVASVGGGIALSQLRAQQRQINAEAERSGQRDTLLTRQLEEAEQRSRANRRGQAEKVYVRVLPASAGNGGTCEVANGSTRPIRWVECRLLAPGYEAYPDDWQIGVPQGYAIVTNNPADMLNFMPAEADQVDMDAGLYRYVLADQVIRAGFPELPDDARISYTVRFLDDAERLWQLNEDMHLEELPPPPTPTLPRPGDAPPW